MPSASTSRDTARDDAPSATRIPISRVRWLTVYAIDVNARARDLTAANAATLGLTIRVSAPDDVPDHVTFAGIWSNPPTHAGKAELHMLLDRWLPRLARDHGVSLHEVTPTDESLESVFSYLVSS